MDRRATVSVLVTLLVVLAGCGGPAATGTQSPATDDASTTAAPAETDTATPTDTPSPTPTDTPTPTPEPEPQRKITVEGGNFSFNATTVYRRVVRMHGLTWEEAPSVTVTIEDRYSSALSLYRPSTFEKAMGLKPELGDTAVAGLTSAGDVFIYDEVVTTADQQEATLAHEYAHVLQSTISARIKVGQSLDGPTTQRTRIQSGLIEGGATFVESKYRVQHMNQSATRLDWNASSSDRTPYGAFIVAPYTFGHIYFHGQIDGVDQVTEVYENPPQTTEQMIHDLEPGTEPPRNLSVTPGDTAGWTSYEQKTKGELFTRLVLEKELSAGTAATAAAGWGNDRAVTFGDGDGNRGFAWMLRWDSASEADQFETAMASFLDGHATDTDGDVWYHNGTAYRLVRPSESTVAVVTGNESFVTAATVTGSGDEYTVAVDANDGGSGGYAVDAESDGRTAVDAGAVVERATVTPAAVLAGDSRTTGAA